MITETQLSGLLLIAALIWGVLLILNGTAINIKFFEPLSTVAGILVLLLSVFDKWAWRWRVFYPWLVAIPYLQGTWKGQLVSNWVNPNTQEKTPPIDVYLVIRQNFSSLHIRLITKESGSESLAGSIVRNPDGVFVISSTYRNTPKLQIRDRSPIHHGGLLLNIQGDPTNGLEGQYWTDRDTKGELRFVSKSEKVYFDYESASTGYYGKNGDD